MSDSATAALTTEALQAIANRYTVHLRKSARGTQSIFVASFREVPLCLAEGEDRESALRDLEFLVVPYLQSLQASGATIPTPIIDLAPIVPSQVLVVSMEVPVLDREPRESVSGVLMSVFRQSRAELEHA